MPSWLRGFRDHSRSRDRRKEKGKSSATPIQSPPYRLKPPTASLQVHDPAEVSPEASPHFRVLKADNSLWALAYKNLAQKDLKLIQNLHNCLKIELTYDVNGDPVCSNVTQIVNDATEEIDKAEKGKDHGKVANAARKSSKRAVHIIIASKDLISSVASANPYAALAWSGVSLLLPLLLNPSQEREAAQKGLDDVVVLMEVYNWHEKSYIHCDDVLDLQRHIVHLYELLLEYQITLLINLHKKAPAQWMKAVFNAGDWSSRLKVIQEQDAYCRDLISAISGRRTIAWRDEERRWQHELLQQPRQQEENRHIRMLYSNYEQGKNINPERTPGTCEWFLSHADFLIWRKTQGSSLLWLSADPGCGKSVLSKYLVDRRGEVLTINPQPPTVCYFFFKDGDMGRMNVTNAMCAILHQLFMQQPQLYHHAKEDFLKKNEKFLEDFDALWGIFNQAAENSSSEEIICVLDALDECQANSRVRLIAQLKQFYSHQSTDDHKKPIVKFLLTSRPEFNIARDLEPTEKFSEVRLRGEEESETISHEIDLVIRHRITELAKRLHLSETDESTLRENLSSVPHRTYLWLHLMFEDLFGRLKLRRHEIATVAKTLPRDIDQAYTAILEKSPDKSQAKKLLHIILAAVTPLSIQEINVAMALEEQSKVYKDLELWAPELAAEIIKHTCGLFVSVVDSKVYLIHQTAREFLVGHKHEDEQKGWRRSFHPAQSNLILAEICIWFLRLQDLDDNRSQAFGPQQTKHGMVYYNEDRAYQEHSSGTTRAYTSKYVLLSYAAINWPNHLVLAGNIAQPALIKIVAHEICDPLSYSWATWAQVYEEFKAVPEQASKLIIASFLGLVGVVTLLLDREGFQMDLEHNRESISLTWAVRNRHQDVTKLLLTREDINAGLSDTNKMTPLHWAAHYGYQDVTRLLLAREDVNSGLLDDEGMTPLYYTARNRY
ncbi:MAG: hypothetical protein LQ352_006335 [Teloschistes flavicans]|nr:MAG: hypothetical protein LQ352_006335 [Teloschistes flavicans]